MAHKITATDGVVTARGIRPWHEFENFEWWTPELAAQFERKLMAIREAEPDCVGAS